MTEPATREAFKEYCLRALGKPVIEINVADEQIEDRIDDTLRMFYDYHCDGTEKAYYKHQITNTDITNGYITIPENIIGVVKVFDVQSFISGSGLFDVKYQFMLQNLHSLSRMELAPFFQSMQHLALINEVLNGSTPIRYNRHRNRLYLDTNWSKLTAGNYIVAEAYEIMDPETYTDVWKDWWVKEYATNLIKRQWGSNLKKFGGVPLPGGITLNGQTIYDEAEAKITELKDFIIYKYSMPANDFFG
jgi:hypothetical protein